MKKCPICDSDNPIDAHTCTTCGSALDQYALDQEVERANVAHKKSVLHKKEIAYGVGAALIGVIALVYFTGGPSASRQETEAFYKSFIVIDEKEYRAFWKCVQRDTGRPANTMDDNLELYRALEGAYNKAPAQYPKFVLSRCMPRIKAFPEAMKGLKLVDSLQPEIGKYIEGSKEVAAAAEKYANELQALNDQGALDAKVQTVGNSFHFDEKDSPDTYAFDNFLRCAIPNYDKLADEQAIVEYLASVRKNPGADVARWRKECVPMLQKTDGAKPHASYKANVKKIGTDDRDLLAFQDLFVKADQKNREALMEVMGKAWMTYFNGWQGVKKRLGEALGSK